MLNATVSLDGLKVPPANRLEALKDGRKGQDSIRRDSQWRFVSDEQKETVAKLRL